MPELILVAGAGGFIGGQLVRDLERQNFKSGQSTESQSKIGITNLPRPKILFSI